MFNRPPHKPKEKFSGSGLISSIESQKTDAERLNIYLDGEYAFSLTALVVAEQHLRSGMELTAERVAELQEADFYQRGLTAALHALSSRPRSESELRTRLKQRYPEGSEATLERIITRLKELKYLNDADFARYWVESRTFSAPRGQLLIKQELSAKGVAKENIEEAINQVLKAVDEDDEEGLTKEEHLALGQARKKGRGLAAEPWPEYYRKLGSFLLRRGYDYGIVKRVVRKSWEEFKDEEPGEDPDE